MPDHTCKETECLGKCDRCRLSKAAAAQPRWPPSDEQLLVLLVIDISTLLLLVSREVSPKEASAEERASFIRLTSFCMASVDGETDDLPRPVVQRGSCGSAASPDPERSSTIDVLVR
jgi:hypothetical protein